MRSRSKLSFSFILASVAMLMCCCLSSCRGHNAEGVAALELPHQVEVPVDVSLCALHAMPQAWDQRLVRVSGYATHGYENSSFVDPHCADSSSERDIWMEYGGKADTNTIYFGSGHPTRNREGDRTVKGIRIPLLTDEQFDRFDHILKKGPYTGGVVVVEATVDGRFFAAGKPSPDNALSLGGYGHFGCCSLLAIQQVEEVAERPLNLQEVKKFAEAFHLPPPSP